MPASTSRTPSRTFSGVSRLTRPSSSSSPQSPQVEPSGRWIHRFVTGAPRTYRPVCTDRLVDWPRYSIAATKRTLRRSGMAEQQGLVVSADGHILEPTDLFITRLPKHLRDRGVWEEDFEIDPLVQVVAQEPERRPPHRCDGHADGRTPDGDRDRQRRCRRRPRGRAPPCRPPPLRP